VELEAPAPGAAVPTGAPRNDRIAALEEEVGRLRAELDALWELTGLADKRPGRGE
jgi:hypothetical protein